MIAQRQHAGRRGAVLAIAALYALLLQAFLGALAPLSLDPGASPHCAPAGSSESGDGPHRDGACCTLACRILVASPPDAASLPAPRPALRLTAVLRDESVVGPAAVHLVRARGPPVS